MQARAWLIPLALIALTLAGATYGEGSEIEVDAPVDFQGRTETWLPSGTVSYIGSSPNQIGAFRILADEVSLTLRTAQPAQCDIALPTAPTAPCSATTSDDTVELTDVSIVASKFLSHYKVVATTDRAHADTSTFGDDGRILITTVNGALGTNAAPTHLSMGDDEWTDSSTASEVVEPVYDAEAYSAQLTASTAAVLYASGGFEAFFQGAQVSVTGTDADGNEFKETYDTRIPSDESEARKALIVEVHDGEMQGTTTAPFLGYARSDQRPVSDVHSGAEFSRATGTVVDDKGERDLTEEDVSLPGKMSITLTKISTGSEPRMTFTIVDGLQLANIEELPTDEPIPPGALAAAGAIGAGGAGGLIALAYFWPRLKFWATLMLLPLYTRIERDAVLEHEKRDELYELIRSTPGIHAHEIGEKAHIGWGTTVYHLKLLENHGLIVSKKSGRYKRFFVNTGEYTKKKDIYGALRNETAKSVAQYIVDHPGTTQKEMCAALSIQPSLASWHVEKLEGVELVKRVKDGRMVRYFAGPAWADLNVRVDPAGGPGADTPAET